MILINATFCLATEDQKDALEAIDRAAKHIGAQVILAGFIDETKSPAGVWENESNNLHHNGI